MRSPKSIPSIASRKTSPTFCLLLPGHARSVGGAGALWRWPGGGLALLRRRTHLR